MTTFKTPGVYVQEISTFPPSVVAVETAVPSFIGYTEKAVGAGGGDLANVPTRITSLLEFEELFGGPFRPTTYRVVVDTTAGNAIGAVSARDAANAARTYHLYNSLRHFYANGGGACYIVSVGSYSDDPDRADLETGLDSLAGLDEPTLLVFPDGAELSAGDLGSLQAAALQQCATLQDRFMISDLAEGDTAGSGPIDAFRNAVGTGNLKYGAAYYPWLQTIYRPTVHFRHLVLTQPDDTAHLTGVLDTLIPPPDPAGLNALVPAARSASADADAVVDPIDAAAALTLDRDNFADMSTHFTSLVDVLRATPDTAVGPIRAAFADIIELPRAIVLNLETLRTATLDPALTAEIEALQDDAGLVAAIDNLIALEKNADVRGAIDPARTEGNVDTDYASLNGTDWISEATVGAIAADTTDFGDTTPAGPLHVTARSIAAALEDTFETIAAAILAVHETAEFLSGEAERPLFEQHPVYKAAVAAVRRTMSLLPASGGVTGVYAATDRTRGVWKAPANVSLADVVGPAVKLNDEDQSGLNVDTTGKSINAIRAFAGKGTLVWGARTLAGNDNEWRYVAVRRFFNMAEESIKKATEPFVFEPNDANTWVRVRAMIENFLTVQWRQGALVGGTPPQAFYVKVGLGETMTAQDILEGRMIIEVGMAVVRPAEFIVLKFAHKMQVS
jgi:phage tail sheath protein FI